LLIGGPNQSHKVIFKELPDEGKSFSRLFFNPLVNTFSEESSDFFADRELNFLLFETPVTRFWRGQ
jgi:hypothetical protein